MPGLHQSAASWMMLTFATLPHTQLATAQQFHTCPSHMWASRVKTKRTLATNGSTASQLRFIWQLIMKHLHFKQSQQQQIQLVWLTRESPNRRLWVLSTDCWALNQTRNIIKVIKVSTSKCKYNCIKYLKSSLFWRATRIYSWGARENLCDEKLLECCKQLKSDCKLHVEIMRYSLEISENTLILQIAYFKELRNEGVSY